LFFPVCFDLKKHILTAERATPSITTTSHLSVNSFIENHLCFFCVCVCVCVYRKTFPALFQGLCRDAREKRRSFTLKREAGGEREWCFPKRLCLPFSWVTRGPGQGEADKICHVSAVIKAWNNYFPLANPHHQASQLVTAL